MTLVYEESHECELLEKSEFLQNSPKPKRFVVYQYSQQKVLQIFYLIEPAYSKLIKKLSGRA